MQIDPIDALDRPHSDQLDPSEPERRAGSLSPLLFWGGMLPAMLLPLVGSLLYFVILSESAIAQFFYSSVKVFTVTWPILCLLLLWKLPFPKIEWIPDRLGSVVGWGVATGLAICGIIAIAMQTPLANGVFAGTANIESKAKVLGVFEHYWLFAIGISLFHSLLEEYYWRWFVFGKLHERIRPTAAYLLGAVAFAAHHVVVLSQYFAWPYVALFSLSVAIGGLLWSAMLVRQRTLLGAWISHALVDCGIFAVGYVLLF